MLRADGVAVGGDDHPFHRVPQLAHVVPPPLVAPEQLHRLRRDPLPSHTEPLADPGDETLGQLGHVVQALAERGHLDHVHVEPVEEILAEAARLHVGVEVAVGRGDDARLDRERARSAQAGDAAVLEHAEELGLRRAGQVADLVQEERAALRRLERARAGWRRRR